MVIGGTEKQKIAKPINELNQTNRKSHSIRFTRMFYATNEVLINLTEKTKLLAQKCTQIRSNGVNNVEHLKSLSKSISDVRASDDKQLDELIKSSKKCASNEKTSKIACFGGFAGSLRLKRRKSLSDTEQNNCNLNRRKQINLSSTGTTRWYVKVSIYISYFIL